MGKALQDFGMQLGQGVLGAGMGILLAKQADARQITQQRKLQDMQMQGQREMTDFNYQKQLEMWKATNYGAQVKQLKEAGLNPGLLYGMAGGGGTTTGGAGANVQGGTAPTGGGEPIHMAGMAMNLGLLKAQKENIEADTRNKLAEIPVKETQVPNIQAQTDSLRQGIKNQQAAEELTRIETTMRTLEVKMANETYDEKVDTIIALTDQAKNIYDRMAIQLEIDRATKQAKINTLRTEAIGAVLRNALTQSQTKVNDEQVKKMIEDIAQGWDRNDIQAFSAEMQAQFPGLGATLGAQINGALEEIRELIKDKGRNRTYKVDRPNKK